ncbi:hypothetical protein [Candidatus Parabeggiatoa sp. HSG14]
MFSWGLKKEWLSGSYFVTIPKKLNSVLELLDNIYEKVLPVIE